MVIPSRKPAYRFLVLLLSLSILFVYLPQVTFAAGGSYSINFAAADPDNDGTAYPKLTPSERSSVFGRASNPIINTQFNDKVESLAPEDLALGQIVPFLLKIEVNGSTAPEDGVIEVTANWRTKTTSGGNFGYDPAYMIYGAFINAGDPDTVDPEGDATVSSHSSTLLNPGSSTEQIQGTFTISGLDDGDKVVLQVWVVLKNTIPAGSTGNVQAALDNAETAAGDTINTGNQTVPLLRVQEFFSSDVDIGITKTDSPDPVNAGSNVTYTITVKNNAPSSGDHAVANTVVVTDELDAISTFISANPSKGTFNVSGQTITWNVGSLIQGETATMTVVVKTPTSFTDYDTSNNPEAGGYGSATKGADPPRDMVNNVSVTTITDDTNSSNNSYFQPTNIKYLAAGSVSLAASKVLSGRTLQAGQFSFQLRKEGSATVLQTKTNAANGTIAFDPINYTQADIGQTYTYTITEVNAGAAGYTYDPMVLSVDVSISDGGNGTLNITTDYPNDTTFNNSYAASGSVVLKASKALSGKTLQAGQFSFELRKSGSATVLQTKTNAADGSITFDAINYTQADIGQTYTYTITEINGGAAGYTYDPMVLSVDVSISDGGNGTLTVSTDYPSDKTFNNSYNATGSIALSASKSLAGRTLNAGEFSFQLKKENTLLQTKTNAANGSITFDAINYTLADLGLHTYTITEVAGNLGGVTYDPMTLTVTVNVTDNGDGTLTATPSYPADTIFNNSYAATGSVSLSASKALSGRTLAAGQFSFQLKESNTVLQTVQNAADGSIDFAAINYSLADAGKTFNYTIVEVEGNMPGYMYDDMTVNISVLVTDNGNGTLTATPTYPNDTTFNNRYTASGSVALAVSKALTGRALAANQFSFQLKEGDTVLQTVKNAANGSVSFAPIAYDESDAGKTFNYTIVEVDDNLPGYTYDGMTVNISVLVTDNGNGTLTATPTYPNDTTFDNSYAASGSVSLAVSKVLTGRALAADQFSFQLKEGDTVLQTVKNAANGSVSFAPIAYDESDAGKTFNYTIVEVDDNLPGYTYDGMTVNVSVLVTDNGNGALTATPAYPNDTTFNNSYAASGSVSLAVSKALTGRALAANQFSFQLKEGDTVLQTVGNAANGSVSFAPIAYDESDAGKTFNYTIVEVDDNLPGYDYDGMTVNISVLVTDNGNGALTATPTYPNDIIFNNSYAASGSVSLAVSKALTGRALAADQFSFQLKEGDTVLQTVKNAADGSVSFAPIAFDVADAGKTFNYTIVEVDDNLPGYDYDPMTVNVSVLVTDNGNGTLTATPTYPNDTTFNNSYAATGSVALAVSKVLTGRALAADQFSFQLKEGDTVLQTVGNAADGSVSFAPIAFDEADAGKTFNYTIVEIDDNLPGYDYDNMVINISVQVIDNGNGTLTVMPSYPNDKTFNNNYAASGSVTLAVSKVLTGRALAANQFSFQLKEGDTVLQTVGNAADGSVSFAPIAYDESDAGKTFNYTIVEVDDNLPGYDYDSMTINVSVSVSDNGDGTLTVTPTYPSDLTFNNRYTASGSVALAVSKALTGRTLAADQFSFQLKLDNTILQTVKNAADGSVGFAPIAFDEDDAGKTFNYTIVEVDDSLPGYTYDGMTVNVSVLVTDNGDGTLTATPTYPNDTTFNNSYAASGSVSLEASKALLGRDLNAGEFSFQLKAEDMLLQTKTNAADGSITFDPIQYTVSDQGLHTYTISEIQGSEANMHYDPMAITVTVLVTDNGDGTLTTTPDYPSDTTFNNEYLAPAITVEKTVANQTAGDPHAEFVTLEDGETAEYRIVVTNSGNMTLENVKLEDDQVAIGTIATLSTGGTATFADLGGTSPAISLGTLEPGESVTVTFTYETRFEDIARSPIVNTATATGTMPATETHPEGMDVTDSDDATIDVSEIPLADIGLEISKKVRNASMSGSLAETATGYTNDVFEFEVTVSNPSLQAPLSEVKLFDNRALIGTQVLRVHDNAELVWVDDGNGGAMLDIGSLAAGASLTFRYRYTALSSDEGKTFENIARVTGVFKPERPGYSDVPIEDEDTATIGILQPPPQTGETGAAGNGGLAGIMLIVSAMATFVLRRKIGRGSLVG